MYECSLVRSHAFQSIQVQSLSNVNRSQIVDEERTLISNLRTRSVAVSASQRGDYLSLSPQDRSLGALPDARRCQGLWNIQAEPHFCSSLPVVHVVKLRLPEVSLRKIKAFALAQNCVHSAIVLQVCYYTNISIDLQAEVETYQIIRHYTNL